MNKRIYTTKELQDRTQKVEALNAEKPSTRLYEEAATNGMSVTAYLETIDPSEPDDSMDAFERQLAVRGIRTKSIPEKGIFADKVDRFYASNQPASIVLFPEFINREMRQVRLQQDMSQEIIALRTPIDGDTYRSIYVDLSDVTKFRMRRVAQGSEIPTAKLASKEQTISLKKYGLRLLATYESVRRMRIDMLRVHLNLIGLQANLDKVSAAVDVLINGDGNGNAATNDNASTLDAAATGGILTYKAWIAWLMNFYPYQGTTVIGNTATLLKVLTMQFPGVDPLMLLAQYSNGSTNMKVEVAQNLFVPVRLVLSQDAPTGVLVGLDKNFALEEINEIGADLTETDKIISSQFNEIVISEVVGFAKMYNPAIRTLTLA